MNRELYRLEQMTISLPYKRVRLVDTTADGYFLKLMNIDADWIINIDEDAFVVDNRRVDILLHYCAENDIDVCGYSDGGVISIRNHNPLVMNPFFNIIHTKALREKFRPGVLQEYAVHKSEYEKKAPWNLIRKHTYAYEFHYFEPYDPFFVWVSQNFNTLYLDALTHSDKYSTIGLDHESKPMLIHTWYSRDYNKSTFHTDRINAVILSILKINDINSVGGGYSQRMLNKLDSYCRRTIFRINNFYRKWKKRWQKYIMKKMECDIR